MGTNVLLKVGFSGHRESRDPLMAVAEAVGVYMLPLVKLFHFPTFKRKKLDWSQMGRSQKAEVLARQMGYASYSQCRHRVDDILAID